MPLNDFQVKLAPAIRLRCCQASSSQSSTQQPRSQGSTSAETPSSAPKSTGEPGLPPRSHPSRSPSSVHPLLPFACIRHSLKVPGCHPPAAEEGPVLSPCSSTVHPGSSIPSAGWWAGLEGGCTTFIIAT